MSLPSSRIASHFWQRHYVIPNLFLSFPLGRRALVPQRDLFLQLLHNFGALSRPTTWHAIAWWDKQHSKTSGALSSQSQYFLFASLSRQLNVLCAALCCELMFVSHSIWFSHMVNARLGSWPLYPCKGIPLCFYVPNGAIHYVPTTQWTVSFEVRKLHVHLDKLVKLLWSAQEMW